MTSVHVDARVLVQMTLALFMSLKCLYTIFSLSSFLSGLLLIFMTMVSSLGTGYIWWKQSQCSPNFLLAFMTGSHTSDVVFIIRKTIGLCSSKQPFGWLQEKKDFTYTFPLPNSKRWLWGHAEEAILTDHLRQLLTAWTMSSCSGEWSGMC